MGSSRVPWLLPAALLLVWPLSAQVRLGETSSNANGTISTGYTANYGNLTGSTHDWTVGGAATLAGSFYSPNFLSFNVSPYLNQSRANSNFQSISDASGVDINTNVFSGSKFPGSFNYSKAYNSEGNYAVPGLANFVTHGNSDTFGVTWSENLPDAPSFSAGFQYGTSQYSVYGTNYQGKNAFHSLNLHSGYTVAGFNMGAYYVKGGGHSVIPQIVAALPSTQSNSDNDTYGFNVSHRLPMQGSFSSGINRTSWNTEYLGYNSTGTIDTVNALASVHPASKLSVSSSLNYSDNLTGQLVQSVVAAGGVAPGLNSNGTSDSLDLMGVATYTPMGSLQTSAFVERRTQSFFGESYGVNSYGGGATYAHAVLDGTFNGSLVVTANSADQNGADTLGFSTAENYSSDFFGWHVTGSFAYAQNVQTLLVTYMNSYYNYSGNVRRRWGKFNVSAGAGAARTALTSQAGTADSSESYEAGVGYGSLFTATGNYSKSNGQALTTGAGLVLVPVPSPALPSNLVSLFGGDSYSFGLASSPVRRLTIAAAYSKSTSNTSSDSVLSENNESQLNVLIQYQVRKLNFVSGCARLEQGFSQSPTQPEVINSYYFGVSRWFNFF
ncbi:MAG TPA: hypothetical protein VGG85_04250 [Terracidiphilus sp.]